MGVKYERMLNAALDAKGREWRNWIIGWEITRRVAPWVLASLLLGGLGYMAHAAWVWMTGVSVPDVSPSGNVLAAVPAWLWILGAVLAAVTAWLFRPGRLVVPSAARLRIIPACALVIVAAGVIGVSLSTLTL